MSETTFFVHPEAAPHTLVLGNPARPHGYVCRCAHRLTNVREENTRLVGWCEICGQECLLEMSARK